MHRNTFGVGRTFTLAGLMLGLHACGGGNPPAPPLASEQAAVQGSQSPALSFQLVPLFTDQPYSGDVQPQGISADGKVAGRVTTPDGQNRGFYYDGSSFHLIGTFGGSSSYANAVNQRGQVAGVADAFAGEHGFIYQNGCKCDIGNLAGGGITAWDINAGGTVIGWSYAGPGEHAFVYENKTMKDLGTLSGGRDSYALALNDKGQIAGYSFLPTHNYHAFIYSSGTMKDLGTLGGPDSKAVAINASGVVTGFSYPPTGDYHAFISDGQTMRDLGTFGGSSSYGVGINDAGDVIGDAFFAAGNVHAFIYKNGHMHDLGTLGGDGSLATAINQGGTVVGRSLDSKGEMRAMMWRPGEGMTDLNARICGTVPHVFNRALAVADNGDIVVGWSHGLAVLKAQPVQCK